MGNAQNTNLPNTEKVKHEYSCSKLKVGICEMQGWRDQMEDSYLTELEYEEDTFLFGIFDGHGGIILFYNSQVV